jgi:hypothetical protein
MAGVGDLEDFSTGIAFSGAGDSEPKTLVFVADDRQSFSARSGWPSAILDKASEAATKSVCHPVRDTDYFKIDYRNFGTNEAFGEQR